MQLFGVVLAFVTIILLSIRRVPLGKVMFAATVIIASTSGMPFQSVLRTVWNSFTDRTTLELAASVMSIGIFSTVMHQLSFLEQTVRGLSGFLGNVKAAIMAVPALIGSMPVLGGAAVSAPLVDKLGEPLDLSPSQKAAINLVFRHGMFFIFPFSPSLVLASKLMGYSVGKLISYLWPLSVVLWGVGYVALLGKVPSARIPAATGPAYPEVSATESGAGPKVGPCGHARTAKPEMGKPTESRMESLATFLRYGSPLLVALVMSLVLKLPLYLSLLAGTCLAAVLGYAEKRAVVSITEVLKGANLNQVVAMFWIMAFKAFVTLSPVFGSLVETAKSRGISPVLMALLFPLVFGFGSASQTTTVGVLLPVLVPAAASDAARLFFTCVVYGSSFMAYFASPLHLCQVLTCQYFGIEIPQVYRLYWPVLVGLAAALGGYAVLLARFA